MAFNKHVFLGLLILSGMATAQSASRIRQAIDSSQATPLHGNVHRLARAEFDRGPVSPALKIQGATIVFNHSATQQNNLDTLIAQQQDPNSPSYHKWLSTQEFADRFGMTEGDIAKVATWLKSQGLTVDRVADSRTQIFFSGTAAQVQRALHTELHKFVVNGETHFANATEPAVPAALASSVLAVRNLNNFRIQPHNLKVRKVSADAHFEAGGGNHFIAPDDLATIYNLKPLYAIGIDGEQSVAVAGQTQINQTDITAFRSASGLSNNPVQMVLVPSSGTSTTVNDDELEADLDVEWSGAVARNAKIIYVYTGNGNLNVIDAMEYAIEKTLAPVISISYGLCEASAGSANMTALQNDAKQAIAKGITISSASGDEGAADCEDSSAESAILGLAVDIPSAIPEVTGVGGTEFSGDVGNGATYWNTVSDSNNASALSYIPETSWNDTAATVAANKGFSAGGGGASTFFAKPSWQVATGVPAANHRYVPDISLNASARHDGYLVCSGGNCVNGFVASDNTLTLVGGTSVGAPVFAGLVGLINQAAQTNGQGNVNPNLYTLWASTPLAFHDITTGDNKVPCTIGKPSCPNGTTSIGLSASAGYDQASGLGSLNMFNLVSAWPGFSSSSSFGVAPATSAVAIATAGASGTDLLTVSSTTAFSGTVALTCALVPVTTDATCSINPASVILGTTANSATATLTVSTVAAHAATASFHGMGWYATSSSLLVGIFAIGIPSRRRRWAAVLGLVVLCAVLITGVGCGGGSSSSPPTITVPTTPGTPAGSFTVVVTAASGSVSHTTNVTVTLQ
jgi:subtilase family serine protease